MIAVKYTAIALFALAAINAAGALVAEAPLLLAGTLWAGIMGVVLLAMDRALDYLRDIRDSLAIGAVGSEETVFKLEEAPRDDVSIQMLEERLRRAQEKAASV